MKIHQLGEASDLSGRSIARYKTSFLGFDPQHSNAWTSSKNRPCETCDKPLSDPDDADAKIRFCSKECWTQAGRPL